MSKERERFTYIGSDISGVINVNPHTSPLYVYTDKRQGIKKNKNAKMEWGLILEETIRDQFRERHPKYYVDTKEEMKKNNLSFIEHPELPYIAGHPDGFYTNEKGEMCLLEIKTCSDFGVDAWKEGVPDHCFAQVQYYLGISKLKKATVVCLKNGWDYCEYSLERSDDYVQYLFDKATDLWENHILKGVAPDPTDKECDRKILNKKILKSKEEGVINTNSIDPLVETIRETNKKIKELKAINEEAKNKCIAIMGSKPKAKSHHNSVSYKLFDKYDLNKESKEKLKEAHPDIYKKFVVKSTSSRLNVKEIKNV